MRATNEGAFSKEYVSTNGTLQYVSKVVKVFESFLRLWFFVAFYSTRNGEFCQYVQDRLVKTSIVTSFPCSDTTDF